MLVGTGRTTGIVAAMAAPLAHFVARTIARRLWEPTNEGVDDELNQVNVAVPFGAILVFHTANICFGRHGFHGIVIAIIVSIGYRHQTWRLIFHSPSSSSMMETVGRCRGHGQVCDVFLLRV